MDQIFPLPEKQHSATKRRTRSDKGQLQLTQRDRDVLHQIGEQTAYCFDQVQGLLARHPDSLSTDPECLSETRTRAIIRRWQKLGLADYRKILYDEPGWVWLTKKGLQYTQVEGRFLEPSPANLEHLYWINETRALIEHTYRGYSGFCWEGERQIRMIRERLQARQKEDEYTSIPFEYRGRHRPDALIRYLVDGKERKREIVCAIEVELSEKSYEAWKKIFLELSQYYTNAHYYVDASIKGSLTKALERFQNEDPAYDEPRTERRKYIFIHDLEEFL